MSDYIMYNVARYLRCLREVGKQAKPLHYSSPIQQRSVNCSLSCRACVPAFISAKLYILTIRIQLLYIPQRPGGTSTDRSCLLRGCLRPTRSSSKQGYVASNEAHPTNEAQRSKVRGSSSFLRSCAHIQRELNYYKIASNAKCQMQNFLMLVCRALRTRTQPLLRRDQIRR